MLMENSRKILAHAVLIAATCSYAFASPSGSIPPIGAIPCEADWSNRSRLDVVTNIGSLQYMERHAERGDVAAQLALGQVRRTLDGKWVAPVDNSFNVKWLERAAAQSSKSAVWLLAKFKRREMTHEALLAATMDAAEMEGNPWAASDLFMMTSGRLGPEIKPTFCPAEWTVDKKCAPEDVLRISTARKWAEIAAEGGNAYAQEWLCGAAMAGAPERGQPKDEKAALKWCAVAAKNSSSNALDHWMVLLGRNSEASRETSEDIERAKRWGKQPWRNSNYFFRPPW